MINRKINFRFIIAIALIFPFLTALGQDAIKGKTVFRSKCGSCHDVALKADMVGPSLGGVVDKWNAIGIYKGKSGDQWLKTWVMNYSEAVNSGLPYAVKVVNFSQVNMPPFTSSLSEEEYNDIIAYIKKPESSNETKTTAPSEEVSSKIDDTDLYTIVISITILILLLFAYLLGKANNKLERIDSKNNDDNYIINSEVQNKTPFYNKSSFKTFIYTASLILLVFAIAKNAINLGRQQGYQPTQPIKFSHALHAGKNKIDCQYCHTSASQGKHANIPSLSTCMNCHKDVKEGPKFGKSEISKIYDAIGYDPSTGQYSGKVKPVEWIRIHDLPDHVSFNHANHVNAGKVACQTCHGPIETMEEVYQFAPLSMGWCVNCHRNHEVQFVDNAYYKVFESYHKEMKEGKRKKVTVSDIGGTECQKCHY